MKKLASLLLAIVLLLSVTGCGNSAVKDRTNTDKKDSIVIAIGSEPETLDPTMGWGHGNSPIVQSTLVKYNSNLEFENDLATSYSLSEDGLKWSFKLRDDAYFSDGEKVTAEDVAFTLETAKAQQGSVDLSYMDKANAVDDYNLEVSLKKPTSIFLNTLASIGIVPKHAYNEDYGRKPIGSGPYKFVEWRPQEQIIFTANEKYYGQKAPIKDVTIVFMSEDAALAAVQAGEVDVAYSSAKLATTKVEGYHVEAIKSIDNRGFTLPMEKNTGKKSENGGLIGNDVTSNKEIRQAIAYAVDRQALVDYVLNGFGRPAYSENDGMPWNNPDVAIEKDINLAKKLLADKGWKDSDGDGILEKDGLKAEFDCIYPSGDSVRQAMAMAVAEQLQEIGLKMNIEGLSWDEISKDMFSKAVLMGWGSAIPNETYYLYRSEGVYKDDYYNPEGYKSELTDSYLENAMEAKTVKIANENWKKVQWDGQNGTSMKGDCPWVWLVNLDHVTYVKDGLTIGKQPIHGHGHGMSLIQNLNEWKWEK